MSTEKSSKPTPEAGGNRRQPGPADNARSPTVLGPISRKMLGVLAAFSVLIGGADAWAVAISPLRGAGLKLPAGFQVLGYLPVVLAGLVAVWIIRGLPRSTKARRWFRSVLACSAVLSIGGLLLFRAYVERHVEALPVGAETLGAGAGDPELNIFQTAGEIQRDLGFKVGARSGKNGFELLFPRVPGAAEKVRQWLKQHRPAKAVG